MANEKLQYEIAALYSGQPEIKKAFDDFAKLNAAGAKVARELDKLAKANKAAGGAIRENRHATAQLGMQFNQFGTQIAGGTSPLLAFQQQIGDVGYALSGMGGPLGKIGSFLAGPWGVAIMVAATALGPYITSLLETKDALAEMGDAAQDAMAKLNASVANASQFTDAFDKQGKVIINTMGALGKVNQEIKAQEDIIGGLQATPVLAGLNARSIVYAQNELTLLRAKKDALNENIKTAQGEIAQIQSLNKVKGLQAQAQQKLNALDDKGRTSSRSTSRSSSVRVKEVDMLLESQKALYEQFDAGALTYGEYLTQLNQVTDGYKRNGDSLKDMIRLQLQAYEDMQRIRESGKFVAGEMDKDLKMPEVDMTNLEGYAYLAQGIKDRNEEIKNSFESIGMSVSDAFKGMLTAGMSWRDGMRGIINAVIDNLWQLFVVKQITGFITSSLGGLFGGGMPTAGNIMASTNASLLSNPAGLVGQFANGTVNAPGGMALVGERGPEIVNLPRGSQVIPAHRSKNMAGGGINITVDARGSADPAAVRAQVQQGILEAAPALIAAAEQRTMANLRRPRLGGAMQ